MNCYALPDLQFSKSRRSPGLRRLWHAANCTGRCCGITYLGHDTRLRRPVAIKEFFPTGCLRHNASVQLTGATSAGQYATIKGRFLEEARTLAQFHHPGIVDVYTCFEENNTAYMVMEFLQGKTLLRRLEEHNAPLGEAEAVGYIRSIAAALQVVHGAGLLHRDLKPDNIMVCPDGRVVLIDFGTAKEYVAGKTQNHSIIVTPGYAPLEQYAQRAQRGTYTDIYALAATLYHLLTGELPIAASDRAMGVALPPIQQFNPDVSEDVAAAVRAGLSIEIAERPQTVPDFLDRLNGDATIADELNSPMDEADAASDKPEWWSVSSLQGGYPTLLAPYTPAPVKVAAPKVTAPTAPAPPSFDFLTYMQANPVVTPTSLAVPQATPNAPTAPSKAVSGPHQPYVGNKYYAPLRNTSQSQVNDDWSYFLYLGAGLFLLFGLFWILTIVFSPAPHPHPPYNTTQTYYYHYPQHQTYPTHSTISPLPVHREVHLSQWDSAASEVNTFSPDGKFIAAPCAEDDTIKLRDTQTGTVRSVLKTPAEHITALAMSPNDKLLAVATSDTRVRVWNLATKAKQWEGDAIANNLTFSRNGKLLAYSQVDQDGKGYIEICDANSGALQNTLDAVPDAATTMYNSGDTAIETLAFSPDSKSIVAGSEAGTIRLWAVATGDLQWTQRHDASAIKSITFAPGGGYLISTGKMSILWGTRAGKLINSLGTTFGAKSWNAFAPNGKMLAAGNGQGNFYIWTKEPSQAWQQTMNMGGYMGAANRASVTPDGKTLLTLNADSATLFRWPLPLKPQATTP